MKTTSTNFPMIVIQAGIQKYVLCLKEVDAILQLEGKFNKQHRK